MTLFPGHRLCHKVTEVNLKVIKVKGYHRRHRLHHTHLRDIPVETIKSPWQEVKITPGTLVTILTTGGRHVRWKPLRLPW